MAHSTRAHLYCRVSSAGQEDGYSLDTQETACRNWCAERGLVIASVAREVWSGAERHRPDLDVLLDRLLPGEIVLAYALDRLSRSQIDTAILIDRIEATGAALALVTEDFEQSATGTFLRNAKSFVAELEREKILERTMRGRHARVLSGKPLAGRCAPYGYQWADAEKSRLDLDPETAPQARLIFDLALAGVSLRKIAQHLAERGILSPAGRDRWTPATLRELLLRPIYTGTYEAYRRRAERQTVLSQPGACANRKQRLGNPDEPLVFPGVAPALVTPAEHEAIKAILIRNAAHSTRNNANPEATLLRAGVAVCGHCGRTLGVANPTARGGNRSAVYRCNARAKRLADCPQLVHRRLSHR